MEQKITEREREREREREACVTNVTDYTNDTLHLNIRCITNMYAVIFVKLNQFEETKGVISCNKSKNDKKTMTKRKNGMSGKFIMIIES
jgi:hypothetical protein